MGRKYSRSYQWGKVWSTWTPYDLEINWFEAFFPWCFCCYVVLKIQLQLIYMIWYVFLFQIQHNDVNMMQPKCLVPDVEPSLFKRIKPLAPWVDSCLSNTRFPGLAHQKGPSARWRHRWVRIWSDSESSFRKGEKNTSTTIAFFSPWISKWRNSVKVIFVKKGVRIRDVNPRNDKLEYGFVL